MSSFMNLPDDVLDAVGEYLNVCETLTSLMLVSVALRQRLAASRWLWTRSLWNRLLLGPMPLRFDLEAGHWQYPVFVARLRDVCISVLQAAAALHFRQEAHSSSLLSRLDGEVHTRDEKSSPSVELRAQIERCLEAANSTETKNEVAECGLTSNEARIFQYWDLVVQVLLPAPRYLEYEIHSGTFQTVLLSGDSQCEELEEYSDETKECFHRLGSYGYDDNVVLSVLDLFKKCSSSTGMCELLIVDHWDDEYNLFTDATTADAFATLLDSPTGHVVKVVSGSILDVLRALPALRESNGAKRLQ